MSSSNSSSEPNPKNTFSQSGASTSLRSASTRSKPPPQVTMSSNAGLLTTAITSLPSPAESLSVADSRTGPLSTTKSLPSSRNMLSEPMPPQTTSLPRPLTRFLLPPEARTRFLLPRERRRALPPRTISLPVAPSRLSVPPLLKSMSLAPLPKRLSALLVPLKVSGPLVPTLLTARATPLASNKAKAIAASTSATRRMPSPLLSLRAPHRSGCTQGNKAVRLTLLLPRPSLPRTRGHKAVGSPGLLLAVDLDEQHPRLEQSRQDREDRARHQPVEPSRPHRKHGDARDHQRQRGDLAQHHPQHEGPAQVSPHGPPAPQQRQLDGHDPPPGGDPHHEHLRAEHARTLTRHEHQDGRQEHGHQQDEGFRGAAS